MSESPEACERGMPIYHMMNTNLEPRSEPHRTDAGGRDNAEVNTKSGTVKTICAECPRQGEDCYLLQGIVCMGPITYETCDAYCTNAGQPCKGCALALVTDDLLRSGLGLYKEAGFTTEEILKGAEGFSDDELRLIEEML